MSRGLMTTYTGRRIDPLELTPGDVSLVDIAHHLALVNRFAGATREPLSVAQHSVYVSILAARRGGPLAGLQGLMHDASEAYLGDVVKWIKATDCFAAYREAEDRATEAIFCAFRLPMPLPPEVEEADRLMVRYEAEQLMYCLHLPEEHRASYPAVSSEEAAQLEGWRPWTWYQAERAFLTQWAVLYCRTEAILCAE